MHGLVPEERPDVRFAFFLAEDFYLANCHLEGQVVKTNLSLVKTAAGYVPVDQLVKDKKDAWEQERNRNLQAHVAETQDCQYCVSLLTLVNNQYYADCCG